MELRSQVEHRLVGGCGMMIAALVAVVALHSQAASAEDKGIESVRANISATEKQKREVLSELFQINQSIRDIARKRSSLNQHFMQQDGQVRSLAQDVQALELKSEMHQKMLNQRLRRLYQSNKQADLQWLFSAQSPLEVEKHHRYLKLMIDSDHQYLKGYLADLVELRRKRDQLKGRVAKLLQMRKAVQSQEDLLSRDQKQKSSLMAELRQSSRAELDRLEKLRRSEGHTLSTYAFFERKGSLTPPIDGKLTREFGTYVDPIYRFRLMHKGLFYSAAAKSPVKAIFGGEVVLADNLPGFGRTVILDHGDNYYTVYAFASRIAVRSGSKVKEGETLAQSGQVSPLFGPGLYFEIRHFTEAIDPRQWIKDPGVRAAKAF